MGSSEYQFTGRGDFSWPIPNGSYRESGLVIVSGNLVGNGVDICDVARIDEVINRTPLFIKGHFTPEEIAYCDEAKGLLRAERYTGRFAAKEAVAKAIGGMPHRFLDVGVVKDTDGKPSVQLTGRAKEHADSLGIEHLYLSISHIRIAAIAFCIATGRTS